MPIAREQCEIKGIAKDRLVFIDDNSQANSINGHSILSFSDFLAVPALERYVNIAIANNSTRSSLVEQCEKNGISPWTIRSRNSQIYDDVKIGDGAIICAYVTFTSNIKIGKHFHANIYSYVEHDCVIGDYVTFAPGVHCNGNVKIGNHVYVGSGAIIKQGKPGQPLLIGDGATIGMGAVVTKNVPPGVTVVGNPARIFQRGN